VIQRYGIERIRTFFGKAQSTYTKPFATALFVSVLLFFYQFFSVFHDVIVILLVLFALSAPWFLGIALASFLVVSFRSRKIKSCWKVNVHLALPVAARILGVVLVVTPIILPFLVVPWALDHPPPNAMNILWHGRPITWSLWPVVWRYFGNPLVTVSSLGAILAGLWLLLDEFSWKCTFFALLVSVVWFSAIPVAFLI
jgi:hypothetical protein